MITTVDVETSWQKNENGGYDPSPFHPDNILVSVGLNSKYGDEYYFTAHSEKVSRGGKARIQEVLDETTLLIGHNIKFDLMWLLESGFKYSGRVYDTMLGEYILNRGVRKSLTLEMSCRRRKIGSKDSRIKEFTDRGIPFQNIPADLVEEYGSMVGIKSANTTPMTNSLMQESPRVPSTPTVSPTPMQTTQNFTAPEVPTPMTNAKENPGIMSNTTQQIA